MRAGAVLRGTYIGGEGGILLACPEVAASDQSHCPHA